jgi:general secretion pathway protein D
VLNLKHQDGRATTLANPRIRVKDGQKARVHIGDKVPVITSTLTATAFVSESVSYLDVGLKLEVEPTISLSREVGIKIGLEVSNIVREIRSGNTLTYQVGTRNANTVLHLKDGETQILAGLISDDERKVADKVPGLGSLPLVGRLFSSHRDSGTKTEIVLLITPRILRIVARPEARITEFLSGTESIVGAAPLVIRTLDKPAAASGAPAGHAAAAPPVPGAPPTTRGQLKVRPGGPLDIAPPAVVAKAEPKPAQGTMSAAAPPGSASFELKGPARVSDGEQFSVAVHLAAGVALRGGTFNVAYEQGRFRVLGVEPGDMVMTGQPGTVSHKVQDAEGRVSVSYTAPADIRGEGTIARIIFQAVGVHAGTSVMRIETPSVIDATGKPLTVPAPAPLTLLRARKG